MYAKFVQHFPCGSRAKRTRIVVKCTRAEKFWFIIIAINYYEIWNLSHMRKIVSKMSRCLVKRYQLACAPIEGSDQPTHPGSLIRVFARPLWVAKVLK